MKPEINSKWKEKESDRTLQVGFKIVDFYSRKEYITFKYDDTPHMVTFLSEQDFMEKFDAV